MWHENVEWEQLKLMWEQVSQVTGQFANKLIHSQSTHRDCSTNQNILTENMGYIIYLSVTLDRLQYLCK